MYQFLFSLVVFEVGDGSFAEMEEEIGGEVVVWSDRRGYRYEQVLHEDATAIETYDHDRGRYRIYYKDYSQERQRGELIEWPPKNPYPFPP